MMLIRRIFCVAAVLLSLCLDLSSRGRLRVAFVGDPQVDNAEELGYARLSVYRELKEEKGIDLAVFMGDIVNEAPHLMAPSKVLMDSIPYPYFCIPGNHDDTEAFRRVFGYGDTTFVAEGVRFVLMDNCREAHYGFSESQKRWLTSVLEESCARRTVLCTHVPLKFCADSSIAIVGSHDDVLLVSAHLHRVLRGRSSYGVEEIGAGAACGSWWRGVKTDGVPYALMNCGAPRGYFIVDFYSNGKYKVRYKAAGRPESEQVSVQVVGDSLFVNVFGGHESGDVSVVLKTSCRSYRLKCRRSLATAPEVLDVIGFNRSQTRQWRKEHKDEFIPLRNMASPHLWACQLPSGAGLSRMRVLVRYRDDNMKVLYKRILPESN